MTAYEAIIKFKNDHSYSWYQVEKELKLSRRTLQRLKTIKPSKYIATILYQTPAFENWDIPEVKDYFEK